MGEVRTGPSTRASHNIARQIIARQKIIRRSERSGRQSKPLGRRRGGAVATTRTPETKQDYLYDEASGQSKWADGSAEVWTANPRLANVAREIMRRHAPVKDAAVAMPPRRRRRRTGGNGEAAERRLRLTEKKCKLDFKLRVALEATGGRPAACGSGLRGLRGGLRAFSIGADAGAVDAGAVRGETAPRDLRRCEDRPREDQTGATTAIPPPHMHAADVTAQFLGDLGHPTTVIIDRRARTRSRSWLKDAPSAVTFRALFRLGIAPADPTERPRRRSADRRFHVELEKPVAVKKRYAQPPGSCLRVATAPFVTLRRSSMRRRLLAVVVLPSMAVVGCPVIRPMGR